MPEANPLTAPGTTRPARAAWLVVVVLAVGVFFAGVPFYVDQVRAVCQDGTPVACFGRRQLGPDEAQALLRAGLSLDVYAAYQTALVIAWTAGYVGAAALIFARARSGIGLFVSLSLALMAPVTFSTTFAALLAARPEWAALTQPLRGLALFCLLTVFYVFPDGRFVPRWTRLMTVPVAAYVLWLLVDRAAAPPLSAAGPIGGVTALGLAVGSQIYRYTRVSDPTARQQTKWVLAGCVGLLVASGVVVLPIFVALAPGSPARLAYALLGPMVLSLLILSLPASFAIAILRHRLWDIDLLINRTLVYAALTASLALLYWGTIFLLQQFFRALTGTQPDVAIVASTLVIAALAQPLRERIQRSVDRRFYRRRYDAARTLAAFSARVRDEVDVDRLTGELAAVVEQTMQARDVRVWIRPPGGEHRREDAQPFDPAPNDPLVAYLLSTGGPAEVDRLELASPAVRALKAAGVRLVVPLVSQGELVGVISLGERLGGQDYSADDRSLLASLAAQAGPALRVAQLVRDQRAEALDRERVEQELRIARQIQHSFLPKELPILPGWHLQTHYQPAREVGGDFYDFVPLPDGKLGLVVGDVTGKGVPSALMMASTRAVMRAAAPRLVTPGQVLARLNENLCPDMPPGMFVTCFYAVLDPAAGRLIYANAGHDAPYCRAADGTIHELRARGMPLGLMPGSVYDECEQALGPGDQLLLYSDGLVEAHDPAGGMFGFPRLRALLGALDRGDAWIPKLLGQLAAFVGPDWEQEDDVSLVTLARARVGEKNGMDGAGWRTLAEFSLPSQEGNERPAMERVAEVAVGLGLSGRQIDRLKTAVAETTMNAIEHGNSYKADLPVEIRVRASDGALSVQISDHGGGATLLEPVEPDLAAKLDGVQSPRGWGLFLVRKMVDDLRVTDDGMHHTVELIVNLAKE